MSRPEWMRTARLMPLILVMGVAGCPEFPLAPPATPNVVSAGATSPAPTSSPGAQISASPLPTPGASASPTPQASVSATPQATTSPAPTPSSTRPQASPSPPGTIVIGTSPIASGSWSVGLALSRPRVGCVAAAMDTRLLVTDGDGQEVVEAYSQPDDTWGGVDLAAVFVQQAETSQMGHYLACGGVSGPNRLVLVGGYNGQGPTPTARIYTSQGTYQFTVGFGKTYPNTWRYASAGAVIGTKLYVAGGRSSSGGVSSALEAYDPDADTWTVLPSLPGAVAGATAVALNGLLYVMGGYDASSHALSGVQVYNPTSNAWTTDPHAGAIPPMLVARHSAASAVLNGRIYVFGGVPDASSQPTNEAEVFDPALGAWKAIAPLPLPLALHAAAALAGKLYVVGGSDSTGAAQRGVEVYTP